MTVRMTCGGCGKTLVLEDVFRGAHCRCQYCRRLQPVPAAEPEEPPPHRERADHPPLADEAEQSRMTAESAQSPLSWRTRWRRSPTILAAIAAFLAGILGLSVWMLSHPNKATSPEAPAAHTP